MPVLIHSHYSPAQGGHAPGDLRDAFCEGFERLLRSDEDASMLVEVRERMIPFSDLYGLLWNCSDILPGDIADAMREDFNHAGNRTYSAAARMLKDYNL